MNGYLVREVTHFCNISVNKCSPLEDRGIETYDFTFVLEGTVEYSFHGKTHTLHKNDAILLPPHTMRSRSQSEGPVRYASFNFHAYPGNIPPMDCFLPKAITPTMRALLAIYPTSHLSSLRFSEEKCRSMLNYILYELLENHTSPSGNEHVQNILKYVAEHLTEKLSLQSISDYVNLSREYTCQLFKKETGKTLTEYINEQKLFLARDLILNKEMSLTDISSHLSFENYNYFSRLYHKHFGMTPSQTKKNSSPA